MKAPLPPDEAQRLEAPRDNGALDTVPEMLALAEKSRRALLSVLEDERRAGQNLRESEERFRQLAENIQEVFWIVNAALDQNIYVSPGYEKIWGRPCAERYASPQSWLEAIHPEDRERIRLSVTANLAKGTYDEEYRIVRPDGSIRWIRDRGFPVANAAGEVVRIVGVARDITERKETEDALRESERRFREQAEILDHAREAIIVRDIHSSRITYWNQGAQRLYGWTAAEAEGNDLRELIFADPDPWDLVTAPLLETGEWHGELKQFSKAGDSLIVSTHITLVRDSKGLPKSALVINFDITAQKKLEEQFLRAQRMESIGTLASGVAHDLNNILAPILMSAPLLRGDLPPDLRERIVTTIEASAQRGADIVKQVLTFARGVEGERVLVQLVHVINEITRIVQETFPKNIAVRPRYNEDVWAVEGDPTQIHQVLLNLCVNARDAMPHGGELTLALENFTVDEQYAGMTPGSSPGPHVMVAVSDTGSGIPKAIIDRIFDPFFTTKEPGKGTGLGLSTVIGIVKSHGGFLTVESEQDRGTTFKIYLPAKMCSQGAHPSRKAKPLPQGRGELVLVVDDEETILQITRTILEKHGYRVATAIDGTEAVALFARQMDEIKVVLADVMMPLMDGVALAHILQKMSPRTGVIACSGQWEEAREQKLKNAGVKLFLRKPYNTEKLLTALRTVLDGADEK
jgi:PAS domain S-box-containing protein